jgi:nucleotide-binding universal stress UspA family protein
MRVLREISSVRDYNDRDRVQPIAKALKAEGFKVWLDTDLLYSAHGAGIEELLQTAECVLVVWSRHSVRSGFVINDAHVAAGRKVLLPVFIDEDIEPPLSFRGIPTTDLSSWHGNRADPAFKKLVGDVAVVVARSGETDNAVPTLPAERPEGAAKAWEEGYDPRERGAAPAPAPAVPSAAPKSRRKGVFISYSRKDAVWLERLQTHLRPLEREGVVVWDDTRLRPGEPWREEIRKAMAETKVAILLISADFLASEFIATDELPPLLKAAEEDGATILPLIISPSGFRRMESLSRFQAVNDPEKPLVQLRRGNREKVLDQVAGAVADALKR